jgi:(2R)-3-sulfolactate dehydrogenase (NADP+)
MTKISLEELVRLCSRALRAVGVSHDAAMTTARALVYADASGIQSHGVSRLPQYIRHIRTGRVRADASPSVAHTHGTAVLTIDADNGLAFPACDLAVTRGIEVARLAGIAFVGVRRSHHFGVASYHLLPAAEHGLVGIAFSNSPAAMPAWMGKQAVFGTNPVALVFPRRSEHPIVIDVSLSAVARGRLMTAARRGEAIPEGWAADKNGDPTRDPNVGLEGLMLPIGGLKGAVLAMAVELLCSAVVGAGMAGDNPSFSRKATNR